MAVLALDLGWTCGWCTWRRGDAVASGTERFGSQSGEDGVRLLAFRQFLTATRKSIIDAGETLDDVAFERVDFIAAKNGVNAAHVWGALWGNLESWCAFYRIPLIGLPVSTVKKHVTGHGSAAKQLVTKRVQELYPHVIEHNEADAVAVLITAKNKHPHNPGAPNATAPQEKARFQKRR